MTSFLAVTWNVLFSTNPQRNQATLDRLLRRGVSIFLLQEANTAKDAEWLRKNGLRVRRQGGRIVAWNPKVWSIVSEDKIKWAPDYKNGRTGAGVATDSPVVKLRHIASKRLIEVSSYHFPSRTDRGRPNPKEPVRVKVLRAAMTTMVKRVKSTPSNVAILYGGDDNVDERFGKPLSVWNFMRHGIQQVTAPSGTHGKRRIDDFRVRGLRPGPAEVWNTPSDHNLHFRQFTFKPVAPKPASPKPAPPKEPAMTINERVIKRIKALGGDVKTRREWGAQYEAVYQARRRNKPAKQPADTLVAHITVTHDDGVLVGDFYRDMKEVERIGYQRFKSGFSYNWGIDPVTGMIGEGQPLDAKGTHTVNDKKKPGYSRDQNYWARAFAMIGMPGVKLTTKGKRAFAIVYAAMILEGALTADPDFLPHSFFAAKDCPTDALRNAMPEIRRMALAMVKEAKMPTTPKPTNVSEGHKDLDNAIRSLVAAILHYDKAPKSRGVVKAQTLLLRGTLTVMRTARKVMPPR